MGRTEIQGHQVKDDSITGDDIDESTLVLNTLKDGDGDTKIQVEETADEDKIRFDIAGNEIARIESTGMFVTGALSITPGHNEGLTFYKDENELNFVRFANSDDGTSFNAYLAYQVAEHLYISPGRGADFYLQQRTNVGSDPYTFPFRVMDDGTAKFEKRQSDSAASVADLASDVAFYVSGSLDGSYNALFGGNVVMSGSLTVDQAEPTITFKEGGADRATVGVNSSDNILIENKTLNKHIVFKVNDQGVVKEGFRLDGAVPEVVVNQTSESLVDFRVESDSNAHMLFVDGSNNKIGVNTDAPVCELDVNGTTRTKAFGVNVRDVNSTSAVEDLDYVLRCIQSSGITITLPAKSQNVGRMLVFKDALGNAASNNITIDGDGSDQIDGAATYVINNNKESVTLTCDGINGWMITSRVVP